MGAAASGTLFTRHVWPLLNKEGLIPGRAPDMRLWPLNWRPGSVQPMRDFLRGAVRLHVLHHAAGAAVHGAWMAAELANHGYKISPGTLYPTLHRMEEEGLLTSMYEVVDGRRRRVYRATAKGRRSLEAMRRALRELANEVLG